MIKTRPVLFLVAWHQQAPRPRGAVLFYTWPMISTIVLTVLSHLAPAMPPPEDPPVYWPCPPHNPLTEYHLWTSTQWDPACYRTYMGTYLNAIHDYWAWVDGCTPGDCDCYAAAWEAFSAKMAEAEDALRHCSLT